MLLVETTGFHLGAVGIAVVTSVWATGSHLAVTFVDSIEESKTAVQVKLSNAGSINQ